VILMRSNVSLSFFKTSTEREKEKEERELLASIEEIIQEYIDYIYINNLVLTFSEIITQLSVDDIKDFKVKLAKEVRRIKGKYARCKPTIREEVDSILSKLVQILSESKISPRGMRGLLCERLVEKFIKQKFFKQGSWDVSTRSGIEINKSKCFSPNGRNTLDILVWNAGFVFGEFYEVKATSIAFNEDTIEYMKYINEVLFKNGISRVLACITFDDRKNAEAVLELDFNLKTEPIRSISECMGKNDFRENKIYLITNETIEKLKVMYHRFRLVS
jgi:uncharacterized protein YqgV (UPF0045/DUF77 family)